MKIRQGVSYCVRCANDQGQGTGTKGLAAGELSRQFDAYLPKLGLLGIIIGITICLSIGVSYGASNHFSKISGGHPQESKGQSWIEAWPKGSGYPVHGKNRIDSSSENPGRSRFPERDGYQY